MSEPRCLPHRATAWPPLAAALALVVYVAVAWVMPKQVFWAPDEGGRFLQINAIDWSHGFSFRLPYQGRDRDPSLRFYPRGTKPEAPFATYPAPQADGGVRFHWSLTFSLFAWPFWKAFGHPGLFVIPLLCGWLIALVTGKIASEFDPRLRAPAILLTAIASPIFFYSQTLWDHTLASLCALTAALVLIRGAANPRQILCAAPFLLAAMLVRLEMIAFTMAAISTWAVVRRQQTRPAELASTPTPRAPGWKVGLALALGLGAAVIFFLALPPRHQEMLTRFEFQAPTARRILLIPNGALELLVNSNVNEGPRSQRSIDGLTLLALLGLGLSPWIRRPPAGIVFATAAAWVLAYSAALHLSPTVYRSLHGLIPVAPYVTLAAAAAPLLRRPATPRLRTLIVLTGSYLLLGLGLNYLAYSSPVDAKLWNTLEWGPRYVLSAYPLLVVLALLGFQAVDKGPWPRPVKQVTLVVAAGMVWIATQQQVRGLSMLYDNRSLFSSWDAALPRHGALVTDIWWLSASLSSYYVTHEVYYVPSATDLTVWLDSVGTTDLGEFTFAALGPESLASSPAFAARVTRVDRRTVDGLTLETFKIDSK